MLMSTGQQKLIPEGMNGVFNESLKLFTLPRENNSFGRDQQSWKDYFDSSYQLIAVMPKDVSSESLIAIKEEA